MILNEFKLDGKVAIVTGASSGLGKAIAEALAQAGADVCGVARRSCGDLCEKVQTSKRRFLEIRADLATLEPIEEIVEKTLHEFGHIDILVNSAGIIRRGDAIDFTEKDWDDVLDLNLKSLFFLSQRIAKEFIRQGHGGKIINVSSRLSFQGGVGVPSYTASKSGVMGITRELANTWAKYGINVNAIAPGYMATDMNQSLRENSENYDKITNRIPAGRWGTPEDLCGLAVFLASNASNYIHGSSIPVDGGWLSL